MAVTDVWADWSATAASNSPAGSATPEIDDELRNVKAQCKANAVALSGAQTITGVKTFSSSPTITVTSGDAVLALISTSAQCYVQLADSGAATYWTMKKNTADAFSINYFNGSSSLAVISATTAGAVSSNYPVKGTELRASSDVGGEASTISFTSSADEAVRSSGVGTILFNDATNRNSNGFIKIYVGTKAYYIPFFDAI